MTLEMRPLGDSGLQVSQFALGSWNTYERLPRETGLAIMHAAREAGISFLDDARYDDRTGEAPIPTGYSEVVFGELFRAAGWKRDDVVVANKLWWEFWPGQDARAELDASLKRLKFDYVDLIYSEPPRGELTVSEIVRSVGELISSGKARAWGILNWPVDQIEDAAALAAREGIAGPCAAQPAYSIAFRDVVESPEWLRVTRAHRISSVASYVLFGGALTGKYERPRSTGRLAGRLDDPLVRRGIEVGRKLRDIAEARGVTRTALAFAFVLSNPNVASVLFGATSPDQVRENVASAKLVPLDDELLSELRSL